MCGHTHERWRSFCSSCWRRLPVDLRASIDAAKAEKAQHKIAFAEIAAAQWLDRHTASAEIERLLGEQETPRHPPP